MVRSGDATDRKLSTLLMGILGVEAVVYATLLWLARDQWLDALLLCIAIAVGWRLLMFLGSFPLAYALGDRRGTALEWVRASATELNAMAHAYCADQLRVSGPREQIDGAGRPVLLVHGFFCNAGIFTRLLKDLSGRPARAINLDPMYWSVDVGVERLKAEILKFSQAHAKQHIVLIAHSMGGVYARYLLAREHSLPVHGLLTLGSPHSGTRLAALLPGGNERGPVRPKTRWLSESKLTRLAENFRLLAVLSWQDNIIVPQSSAIATDAPELEFSGIGHVALLYHPRVRAAILATLKNWDT